ncbi:Beta-xylosidase [Microbacterium sp. cf046]|uniref:glycoside hydrolase family 43 protein n=1 Tax=Microbacterium sp. cf046 TaxID=1761803 RepID=UPI0008E7D4BF|nr:glycoside hydrolase family 43 protein [Microbacterium sp. cf046]SFS13138.1 Beta-xylosidase [Microbacterium sp. cf046]
MTSVNPILPGFNPDPSVVLVDDVYYLVTSTFEYLPGMPVYRSDDLEDWTLIGHVATREEQIGIRHSPTPGGVFAPTIRFHDGRFHVIVSVMFNARGCVVFTADRPEGPWSDGVQIPAVDGIDPDLAWDDEGNAYVTYAVMGQGIRQLRVDLETGEALTEPRALWSGTGHAAPSGAPPHTPGSLTHADGAPPQTPGSASHAPEGPHLYRRGDDWYLLIAEGGTERGHTVAIARGTSPEGPFEGFAGNPILTARSTSSPVQNVGHADLVDAPGGGTALVALGVRPCGFTRSFSPLGRETFLTRVDWVDGWPQAEPIVVEPRAGEEVEVLDTAVPLEQSGWIAVRQTPAEIATVDGEGRLVLTGHGTDLADPLPSFVGRRQSHIDMSFSAVVDAVAGVGGIAARHSEQHWFGVDAHDDGAVTTVTARAALAGFTHEWRAKLPSGGVKLSIRSRGTSGDLGKLEVGGDRIQLVAAGAIPTGAPPQTPGSLTGADHAEVVLAELDGRYWAYETTESFTGRVLGLYAIDGVVTFADVTYRGRA